MMSNNYDNSDVFIYTGPHGERPPQNIARVQVDSSISSIPATAFCRRTKLAEVELCEGLVEIGERSFGYCGHSITKIIIPSSLRKIRVQAFVSSLRCPIHLHDDIESIGKSAFASCIFTNFRVPPLITVIPNGMLSSCKSMFSAEITHNVTEIRNYSFAYCYCLRNVAFPPNADIGDDIFFIEYDERMVMDLCQLFGSESEIIRELQRRFDDLPIHSIVYYQSYNQGVLHILIAAINMRSGQRRSLRSKLNPTGNQQDCLGMTPLHILACSSVHNLELYRVIIENYPTNLITEDRWGALPLLYALWGAAPTDIIQFLLQSYQSLYPGHVFNWTMMLETMGRTDTPKENIENLLCVKQMHFPEQPIDWGYLLDKFAQPSQLSFGGAPFLERMIFFFMCGMILRVDALAFKVWRDHITNMIQTADFEWEEDNRSILYGIREKLDHFDDELLRLKETTTILELALWKMKMSENGHNIKNQTHCQEKMKADDSSSRSQNRVTCGADFVIGHVLPFLISD